MPSGKKKSYRLFKVAKELNVGSSTLVEHLQKEGFEVDNSPNAKLDPNMYDALLKKFASEKRLKQKADQVKGYHEELKQNLLTQDMMKMPGGLGATPALTPEQLKNKLANKNAGKDKTKEDEPQIEETSSSESPSAEPKAETSTESVAPTEQPSAEDVPTKDTTAEDTTTEKTSTETTQPEATTEKATPEAEDAAEKDSQPPETKADDSEDAGQSDEADGGESDGGLKVVGKIDLDVPKSKGGKSAKAKQKAQDQPKQSTKKASETAEKREKQSPKAQAQPQKPAKAEAQADDQTSDPDKDAKTQAESEAKKASGSKSEPAKHEADAKAQDKSAQQPEAQAPPASTDKPEASATTEEDKEAQSSESNKLKGLTVKGKINLDSFNKKSKSDKSKDTDDDSGGGSGRKRRRRRRKAAKVSSDEGGKSGGRGKSGDSKGGERRGRRGPQQKRGGGRRRQKLRREKRDRKAQEREMALEEQLAQENVLQVTEFLTANELANLMSVNVNNIIAKSFELGYMVSINQRLDREVIELIADEFDFEVEFQSATETWAVDVEDDSEEDLILREPIVTVMGHVDHGKTSLLDHIRSENVIAGEAGGITQHIGAYKVKLPEDGRQIAFLDTPGHEAFTAMRARGAQVTDVAIIVVAADDAVMPQTKEAINHAQAADVPMIFAINKIDKEGANPQRIYEQLSAMGLLVEDWGGEVQSQEISALKGEGVDELLEKVLLQSELLELKANPDRKANGTVIEAELDKGRGVVSTIMVQNGTLRMGDVIIANMYFGRIKAMKDERGQDIEEAGPSTPVQILGLNGVPTAGDKFNVMASDKDAREIASKREQLLREQRIRTSDTRMSLDQIAARGRSQYQVQDLNIVVKGDVDGSVEALADSLIKLTNDEIKVNVIMKGVGGISESDVLLASASDAVIIGFQVRPSPNARKLINEEKVDLRTYSVIYDAINEVKDAIEGMLQPELREEVTASLEVRDIFKISRVGTIAGCKVVDGTINRNDPVRLIREGVVIYEGQIDALKRFKEDVTEVKEGFECGLSIKNYNDIKVGDVVESYKTVEVQRSLESVKTGSNN